MKCSRITLLLSFIAVLLVPRVWADFDDIGLGARPIGMSNAFTAVADDVYAIYYNPAGLAFLDRAQFSAEYGRLYMGLDDDSNLSRSFLGYAHPLHVPKDKKRFWKRKVTDPYDLPYRDFGTVALGLSSFSLGGEYEERTLYVSYARIIRQGLSAGVNIKNLYEKYSIDDYLRQDPVFNYGHRDSLQTISFDVGLLYHINNMFSLGLSIWDINQPDVGLMNTNRLKRQYRFGGSYRMRRFLALMDVVKKEDDLTIHTGVEQWLFRRCLGFRGGYTQGSRNLKNYSVGMSVSLFDIQLDYAFLFPVAGIKDVSGSHRVTFLLRFGYETREQMSDTLGEAFIMMMREKEKLSEEYIQMERMKNKLEEKYLEESHEKQQEINDLKKREEGLIKKLKERPYRVIKPKPKKRPPIPATYTVREGDTLRSIAQKLYGDPLRWNDLYQANKEKIKRSRVEPGEVLVVPR